MDTDTSEPTQSAHPWWVSWYGAVAFEYHGPWWISGHTMDIDPDHPSRGVSLGPPIFCAAVMAPDSDAAEEVIIAAHDERPQLIEWRFVEGRHPDWHPFTERFPRAPWMRWPWPTDTQGETGT